MIKKFFIQNKFCVILALLGAILLTLLTPHFYVKSEYWQNKLVLSEEAFVNLGFHQTTSDNLKNIINITKFSNIDKNVVINKLSDRFYEIKYKYHFILYPKTMQFDAISFYANSESEVVIEFPYNVNVKKFFINNVDLSSSVIKEADGSSFYIFKIKKGESYNIKFLGEVNSKNVKLLDNINLLALFLTYIFYSIFAFFIFKNRKSVALEIKKNFKQNKFLIVWGVFGFIVCIFYVLKMLKGVNYLAMNNIFMSMDTKNVIRTICFGTARQYHAYGFLPFYPFFDSLILLTKNLTLTLSIIYSAIITMTVGFVYKSVKIILPKFKFLPVVLTLIFAFSYTIMFNAFVFEFYPITGFYLSILIYLSIRLFNKETVNSSDWLVLTIFCALTFGVAFVNIVTALIFIVPILLVKANKRTCFKFLVITFAFVLVFASFKSLTNDYQSLKVLNVKNNTADISRWVNNENRKDFAKQALYMPMLANYKLANTNLMKSFWVMFAGLIFISILLLMKNKTSKGEKVLYLVFLSALAYNILAIYVWDSVAGFMFAQNHFALWFVVFSSALKLFEDELNKRQMTVNNNFIKFVLIMFLIFEIPANLLGVYVNHFVAVKKSPLTSSVMEIKK